MRPPVSIVVPFKGDGVAAAETMAALRRLALAPGDELIVADNNPEPVSWPRATEVRIVPAGARPSAYFARNRGAVEAVNDWILFLDADCVPPAGLLETYLDTDPGPDVGILAGEVQGAAEQAGRLARWARSRRGMLASHHQGTGSPPAGITGNLLVRKATWAAAAGFDEEARSDADIDFCWRAQAAGWTLLYSPSAVVGHRDPERLGAVLRQAFLYGTGRRWLRRRHGSSVAPPGAGRKFVRGAAGAIGWPLLAQPERGLFKLIDALVALAMGLGYALGDNRTPRPRG